MSGVHGHWLVPFTQSPFGPCALLPWRQYATDEIVLVIERTISGWSACAHRRWASLPHQLYIYQLQPLLTPDIYELAAVGLRSGKWAALWCASMDQRTVHT